MKRNSKKARALHSFFRREINVHPYRTVIRIFLIAMVFCVAWVVLLHLIGRFLKYVNVSWLSDFLSAQGSTGVWFSFFGSYFGVIATVVLGILTIRFTIRQEQNKELTAISGIKIDAFKLFDTERDRYPDWGHIDTAQRRYILQFNVGSLPAYYDIEEIEAKYCFYHTLVEIQDNLAKWEKLANSFYRHERGFHRIYFNETECQASANNDSKKTFNYFYRLSCYEPMMLTEQERQCLIWLTIRLRYQPYLQFQKSVKVLYKCCLEYKDANQGFVDFDEKDRRIMIEGEWF